MKQLSRADCFKLFGIMWVDIFSISELVYPNMKIRLRLIRTTPNVYMFSDNPDVSLGIVDFSLYTRRVALKDDYHQKRMDMLAYNPVEFNSLKLLQILSSLLPDKTSSLKKTFSTRLQFAGLLLQGIQTLHSPDLILKIHSGINSLILEKL